MRMVLTAVAASVLMACSPQQSAEQAQEPQTEQQAQQESAQMQYPETRKGDVVDTYFETEIADPYRWLEDDRSEETGNWVKAQNEVTFDHLENIPFREKIEARLTELWNYEKVSAPRFEGDYIYFYKNDGLQNQYVVYRKKSEDAEAEVFLDPNTFSEDGTTSLAQLTFSEDGSIAAYSISEGGSDWRKIIVIDAETGEQLEEPLVDVKFSGISWKGNDGFYYSSYDKPEGSELSAKTDQHKLYYHELGTAQSDDQLIFGGTEEEKHRYVGGYVTEDDRFLVVSAANSTSGNTLYIKDLSDPDADLVLVDGNMDYDTSVLTSRDHTLYLETNMDAPNGRVVTVDASNPQPENWQDFIAHSDNVLNPSTGAGYIFAEYMVDAVSKVEQYDYDGNKVRDIELPGVGSASGFSEKQDAEKVFYSFTNYSTPQTIYEMNPDTGESVVYEESGADFDSSQYVSKQVFYTSKDGTKVPMIITHKKGMALDGSNPTILYGYGGFNISLTPSFSIANAAWLEMGGVYAVANLRGGGEYGKEWHKAGTKMQKQNVFDDFIAAGEYLIDEDYTSSERLAVRGGSNGGLLVGAVMTQRPELFAVALPAVGVLDMLRYHTFTAGAGWAYDYGTAEDSPEMFEYLLNYSPVHNVEEGVAYPATLITTGDHDDRVVPAHSFKFAAELQEKAGGDNPQLIRIETNAGHGAGTPVSKTIEQYSDIFGFTLYHMGYESLPQE
ncbi:MAG: S9 family peptidase [Idiomarina sp.]|nr:S9 family peptidase [Idiomarina sp.]